MLTALLFCWFTATTPVGVSHPSLHHQAGDASGTGCLDVRARCWDAAAMALVDPALQGWLPPLIGPDEVGG